MATTKRLTKLDFFKTSHGFRCGQRVRLTAYGQEQRIIQPRSNGKGTVEAITGPLSIRVLPDGYKHPREYNVNFWEPIRRSARHDGAENA